jgi:hypothetical protein
MKIKASTCEWMRRASLFLTVTVFIFFWASFADFGGAKSDLKWKDISSAGTALWIFLILGAIIILLQLVPAIIMFFSLVGTGTQVVAKKSEKCYEENPIKEEVIQ